MPGSIAANAYEGYRSEYLALYAFSMFGTAVVLPNEADYGLDLACTLTEREGRVARPYAYYSLQVKSGDLKWEYNNSSKIKWLVEYPAPLLFCTVEKDALQIRVYHMSQRHHVATRTDRPELLTVIPGRNSENRVPISWDAEGSIYLGDPILDFTVMDLQEDAKFATFKAVLSYWVESDLRNIVRQQMAMRASSGPSRYVTNEVPSAGFGTFSITVVPDEVLEKAQLTAAEHLEWLGRVLFGRDDRVGALLAGLMIRHLLPGSPDPRDLGFDPGGLYTDIQSATWPVEGIDEAHRASRTGSLDGLLAELEERTS
jgi:hypothetical protein